MTSIDFRNLLATFTRRPILSLYIGFLAVLSFLGLGIVFFTWGLSIFRLATYFMSAESIDGLLVVVEVIIIFGYTLALFILVWFLAQLLNFILGSLKAYQNVITASAAITMLGFIFLQGFVIPLDIRATIMSLGLPLEAFLDAPNLSFTIIALLNVAIIFGLAHYSYYPDYRKMSIMEVFRDLRVIRVTSQIFFAFIVLLFIQILISNIYQSLAAINAFPNFDFIYRRAGFQINQRPDWYSSNSRYGDAFMVGVLNTISIVWIGLVLSTIIGIFLGIFLLSRNWLIRNISAVYVEILRNTPLLVQLVFWYFVVWLNLPEQDISFPNESVMVVWLRFFPYLFTILGMWFYVWRDETAPPRMLNGVLTGILILEAAFYFLGGESFFLVILLAALGAALIYMTKQKIIIPESQEGLALGIGVLALSQFVGYLMLDGLALANVIENARFVYGEVIPAVIISRGAFILPEIAFTLRSGWYALILLAAAILVFVLYLYWSGVIDRTGRDIPRTFYAMLIFAFIAIGGWYLLAQPLPDNLYVGMNRDGAYMIYEERARLEEELANGNLEENAFALSLSEQAFLVRIPERNRFGRVEVGTEISPNYMALLIGLVIYTSAFIGEIVRAGIQAVPYGQIEAARALGLSSSDTLSMIVLPQALRVILPPLGNQYLNLAKNSSLATAIAFSDTYQVGLTVMNQSAQSVTGFLIILVVYLTMSLTISFFMNIVNNRFQIVSR